ncbi:MAG: hypothetical protein QGG36_24750 [Pirellulaceae bacterium]|nr:hypothetical protein [Pirellulaceae bacterium]MDP7019029.1 hypothetical protein [Pirellulaceae bacterium]
MQTDDHPADQFDAGELDFNETQHRHYRQCLKEAIVAGVLWTAALIFCGVVFFLVAYPPAAARPDTPPLVLGVPSWAFWGVVAPWFALIALAWLYAVYFVRDDEPFVPMPPDAEPVEGDS